MKTIFLELPLTEDKIQNLNIADKIMLSGKLITARDAAHFRMAESLSRGEIFLPDNLSLKDYTIYYCGPTPAKKGFPIGSCGPTTSGRMDVFTQILFKNGLRSMIGKGKRNQQTIDLIKQYKGVYLIAIGGAGAMYASCVINKKCLVWEDLGTEAIYELTVKDFPCYVGIDFKGNDIYNFKEKQGNFI